MDVRWLMRMDVCSCRCDAIVSTAGRTTSQLLLKQICIQASRRQQALQHGSAAWHGEAGSHVGLNAHRLLACICNVTAVLAADQDPAPPGHCLSSTVNLPYW